MLKFSSSPSPFAAALKIPEIRRFIGTVGFFTLASRALAVIIGFQIYQITHSALALGWLGLVEAIPAIVLAPLGGYAADRFNRRTVLLLTRAVSVLCTLALAWFSWEAHRTPLAGLYAMIFLAGVARGFADPASAAFEAQVVPKALTVNASSWISSTWITCSVVGPAAVGFAFDAWGAARTYAGLAFLFSLSWALTLGIAPKPHTRVDRGEPIWFSIRQGWRFLWENQPLIAAMALDMFSVFLAARSCFCRFMRMTFCMWGRRVWGCSMPRPPWARLSLCSGPRAIRPWPAPGAICFGLWPVSGSAF
jgi:MFS family permease